MFALTILAAVTLNSTTYTEIELSNAPVVTLLVQCRSAIDVYLAESTSPDEAYWTLKSGDIIAIDFQGKGKKLYAKSASGTPQLEIAYLK